MTMHVDSVYYAEGKLWRREHVTACVDALSVFPNTPTKITVIPIELEAK